MRARSLWSGAVLLVFGLTNARGEQPTLPDDSLVASCPTILPETEGERSIVVPTVAPQVEVPHVASRPVPTGRDAAKSLLKDKLAERDRLQREIAALRETTNTPEQVLVRVKLLEINLTKLRRSGIDFSAPGRGRIDAADLARRLSSGAGANIANDQPELWALVDALAKRNLGKVLAEPSVVVTGGQPASLSVGGEFPIPQPGPNGGCKIQKYGTQLDVAANSIGDNRVRLEVRPRVSEIDASNGVIVAGQHVPALTVREFDTAVEMEFGKSFVLSGLVKQRLESAVTASGVQTDEVQEIALVVVVTPEIVR